MRKIEEGKNEMREREGSSKRRVDARMEERLDDESVPYLDTSKRRTDAGMGDELRSRSQRSVCEGCGANDEAEEGHRVRHAAFDNASAHWAWA